MININRNIIFPIIYTVIYFIVYKKKEFPKKLLGGLICAMFLQDLLNQNIKNPIIQKQIMFISIFTLTEFINHNTFNVNKIFGIMFCLIGLLYYDLLISPILNLTNKTIDFILSIVFMLLSLQSIKYILNNKKINEKEIIINVIAFSSIIFI